MTTCREPGCKRQPAFPGQGFCREHALRWTPGAPVEREPMSPFVQRALAGKLPAKALA